MNKEMKFYEHVLLTWFLLFVYPPFGIILLWKIGHFDILTRSIISLFFALLFLELHNVYSSFTRALIFAGIIVYIVYRYHKLQDYETKVKNLFYYALNHLEIEKIFTNYLTRFLPPTKNLKDQLLFEIFLRKEYPLIYKHLNLTHKEDTYINIIYKEAKYLLDYEKDNEESLSERLKEQENTNNRYLEELLNIKNIVSEILKLKGEKFSIYFTFMLLKEFSITYYAEYFNKLYGEEFTNINDACYQYIQIESLSTDINSQDLAMFTYYLMHSNYFNDNEDFYKCIDLISNEIKIQYEIQKEKNFSKYLFTSSDKLLKEIEALEIVQEMKTKERFTIFILDLFKKLGYENINTPLNKYLDYIITLNKHQFGVNIVYQDADIKVKMKEFNNLVTGLKYNNIDKGILITNNYFTEDVINLAEKVNIILWDQNKLKQKALEVKRYSEPHITTLPFENISITEIDNMTDTEFKYYTAELFKRKGYHIKEIINSHNKGIDLIVEKNSLTFGIKTVKEDIINTDPIKEIITSSLNYHLDNSIVITNKSIAKDAIILANACKVILWDREYLNEQIKKEEDIKI